MPPDEKLEVYRQHRTAQDKYTYFLLAAVGASIAFAVNQTQEAKLMWSQLPLGCAVIFWALSFYFGCRQLVYVESTLSANAALLKVTTGEEPPSGRIGQYMAAAREGINEALETNSKWALRFARWQYRCLVLGALAYLGWHVTEMWLRS